jgi:hypothetical protein
LNPFARRSFRHVQVGGELGEGLLVDAMGHDGGAVGGGEPGEGGVEVG